jgi:hypothetical protein
MSAASSSTARNDRFYLLLVSVAAVLTLSDAQHAGWRHPGHSGDLPGALAALREATLQQHADGTRLLLGQTLRVGAGMLARIGEAAPAAVLSGAVAAHFPGSISARNETEQVAIDQSQALARHALGQAAYDAAVSRGAAMDEDEVAGYAVGEFRRVAALLAEPGARAPHAPKGPASGPSGTIAVPPRPG